MSSWASVLTHGFLPFLLQAPYTGTLLWPAHLCPQMPTMLWDSQKEVLTVNVTVLRGMPLHRWLCVDEVMMGRSWIPWCTEALVRFWHTRTGSGRCPIARDNLYEKKKIKKEQSGHLRCGCKHMRLIRKPVAEVEPKPQHRSVLHAISSIHPWSSLPILELLFYTDAERLSNLLKLPWLVSGRTWTGWITKPELQTEKR